MDLLMVVLPVCATVVLLLLIILIAIIIRYDRLPSGSYTKTFYTALSVQILYNILVNCITLLLFTQPLPVGGGCVYVLQMFFFVFFRPSKKYETTVLGNG